MIYQFCIFFLSAAVLKIPSVEGGKGCGLSADVVFILDASRSIWPPYFKAQLKFVEDMATSFDIGTDKTRIGVVTFSVGYQNEFLLNSYSDKDLVIAAIKNITFTAGDQTDTGLGLRYARDTIFNPANGARPNLPQIAIVITDGKSTNGTLTLVEAQETRNKGITIFAIGVGAADLKELNGMASKPSDEFVVKVDNYSKLKGIKDRLALKACEVATTPAPTTTTTTTTTTTQAPTTTTKKPETTTEEKMQGDKDTERECSGKNSDIIFVLDKSSSIDNRNFSTQLTFVNDVISLFDIGPSKTQIGVLTFSDVPKVEFYLKTFQDKKSIMNAVSNIEYTGGNTYTNLALEVVREQMLSQQFGARPGLAKIVIVITDGISRRQQDTAKEAASIKASGVYMFAVGVGTDLDMDELKNIGSRPESNFVYQVNGYNALGTIKNLLAFKTCSTSKDQKDILTRCGSRLPADVMFVTDFSQASFAEMSNNLEVIGNVAQGLDVGRESVHVGLESSDCPDVTSVNPLQYYNAKGFARAISVQTDVKVSKLLASARQTLTGRYSRKNSKRVIVLFTSGPISDFKETARELQRAYHRINNIRVIMVAGSSRGEKDILQLVAKPADQFLVRYKELGKGQGLLNRICNLLRSPV
ncbi:hypothetical protein SNE40_013700 [Patella caerulea]|uniref:VWFA domain-containing protein n=1 Tax=Patella caerulea TaxID=87958 RepID=A0AAN8PR19_PATCE